ncbi:DNRLRE domain-containing protein [Actinoplanes palleronii]|uniref:DNRLRE domain-containing protein n=1 Tax=Actinoplanes palleronii TaxID=113570 RepID=UPI001944A569|nr:DNRLRE domain-containing protein [Actinoplanes palleronii]
MTYARPDGSLRSELATVPVRIKQSDGSWADVDYDLTKAGAGYAPKVSPSDVVFSGGGDGPAVTLGSGSRRVEMSWAKDLPAPTIEGPNALYQLNANEVLVLTATSDGFEQSLKLLAPPTSAPKQRLGFDMTGVSMVANGTGGYDFVKTVDGEATSTVIFTMPKPRMYSSQVVNEERTQVQAVPATLKSDDDGSAYLDLSAGMPFLTDPATVYPVWIDPTVSSVSRNGDTYVTQADADSHVSDSDLRIGVASTGNIRRSLVRFSTTSSVPAGSHVTNATLKLYNNASITCTARSVYAYPITESYTMTSATWANQPSYSTSSAYAASASFAYGNESLGCANGTGSIAVTNMVQAWVSGTLADNGMLLKAGSETDTSYAKYFCSMNIDATGATTCSTSARFPTMSVVYDTYPGVPTTNVFSPRVTGTTTDAYLKKPTVYSPSLTPTFTSSVSNADGAKVSLQVKLSRDVNYTSEGTGEITTVTSAAVNPGAKASVTVPSGVLTAGTHVMYQVRARVTNGAGGYDYSAWSPASLTSTTASKIALNISVPAAPAVSCGSFPSGTWASPTASTTSCTFDTVSADGAGYYWGLDDPATPNLANDSSNSGAAVTVSTVPAKTGWHTLYVRSRDTALHLSTGTTAYTFGVGAGGVLTPAVGASTAKGVALSSSANSTYTGITYQWAPGSTSTSWTDLPAADVTSNGSSTAISGWPLAGTASGSLTSFSGYNWNVAATLAAAGEPDGALRIRAKFSTASGAVGYSAERLFSLAVTTFGQNAATEDLGPGTVSLTTGDFAVSAGDAAVGSLSIGRAATSLAPASATTGATGIFGSGWSASLPSVGASDATLIDNSVSGSVVIREGDGTESVYVKQVSGTYSGKYLGVGDANDGSVLAKSTSIGNPANSADTTSYTGWQLTDTSGTITTWLKASTGAWLVAWVDRAGKEGETTYGRDSAGRVTTILAPTPTGVTCTTASFNTPGCTALQIVYATATTATGTDENGWGNYSGLASGITWTGYDPASSAMTTKSIAVYQYDSTGHLRSTWDPRQPVPLKTRYSYDGAGRIATITPPGVNAWALTYDTAGRLASVSRTDPANGNAIRAIVYNLPVSGLSGAPDVSESAAATWGQISDLAYTGAAVFPASHVPATGSNGTYAPSAADWPYADIKYADIDGNVVSSAAYGAGAWQIDSVRYDDGGSEIWSLDAGSRAHALNPTADTDPYAAAQTSSAVRADLLATISTYSDDGADLISTLEPAHLARLSDGTMASIRSRTAYTYDAGAPTSDASHLVTKTVTQPVAIDGSTVPAADTRTVVTGYDPIDGTSTTGATSGWTLFQPTTTTTWMGTSASSDDLTTKTRYDSSGRVVESRLPGGSASDANTTVTTYYSTAANSTYSACGAKPYWAGLVCRTDPGGSPSAGHAVASTVYTYDLYRQQLTAIEMSGAVTRTTTTGYDTAGRKTSTTAAVAGLSTSTSVSKIELAYDSATGGLSSITQDSAAITAAYDAIGRQTSYTDADGSTSTRTYDIDDNLRTNNDGKGTTSYTYDSATEHRGLVTAMETGMGGNPSTFGGVYDAAGSLVLETYPNGMTAVRGYDNVGNGTGLTYTLPTYQGGTAAMLSFSAVTDAQGQTVQTQSPLSAQDYTFDNNGRLSRVEDTVDGSCATRVYGYDKQADRTSVANYAAGGDGTCQSSTVSSTSTSTYDTANRVTTSGYTYDQLGRTLTVPVSDLASGSAALAVSYYDTDKPKSFTQGTAGKSFTIDPEGRYRQVIDTTAGTETSRVVNHYGASIDSPSWIARSTDGGKTTTWARNVLGIGGDLAAVQLSSGGAVLEITNLHGDIVATVPDAVPTAANTSGASTTAYFESTEFGAARGGGSTPQYAWLGGAMRSAETLGGLVLMGVRLYNPASGRFLTPDPVPGGSDNAYAYPSNPIDGLDLSGQARHFKTKWSRYYTHLRVRLDKYYSARFTDSTALAGTLVGALAILYPVAAPYLAFVIVYAARYWWRYQGWVESGKCIQIDVNTFWGGKHGISSYRGGFCK